MNKQTLETLVVIFKLPQEAVVRVFGGQVRLHSTLEQIHMQMELQEQTDLVEMAHVEQILMVAVILIMVAQVVLEL